jgi:hypothetical protein
MPAGEGQVNASRMSAGHRSFVAVPPHLAFGEHEGRDSI